MNRPIIVSAILSAAITLQLHAQQSLTLEQARALALEYNKDIVSAQLTLAQTGHDVSAYRSNFYPRVSLIAADLYSTASGNFEIAGGHLPIYTLNPETGTYVPNVSIASDGSYTLNQYADFPTQTIEYKIRNLFMGGISLQQPIYMGGKITSAYHMAQIGQSIARSNIRLTEAQVIMKTDEAYMQAVKAQQMLDVAKSYKTLLDELMKNVEAAVRHGLKTRNDQLKVQVKCNEAELAIQRASNACQLTRMNLCHIVGLPLDRPISVTPPIVPDPTLTSSESITSPTSGEALYALTTSRPESAILNDKTRLADEQVKLTRSDFLPNIALFAGASYANGVKLAGKKLLDSGSSAIGVTVKVPFLTFGERTSKVRSARAKQQIAQIEQQDLTEQMMLELAQARNNLEEAVTELDITWRSLQQAEENMETSRQQYDVGLEPLSELLDAQAIWQKAQADHINASCQLTLAYTRYLKASGQLR